MKYEVLWTDEAEAELAELWIAADAPASIEQAANAIDKRLRRTPQEAGESRGERLRILLIPPLGVEFEVFEDDRRVFVGHVWRFRTRGSI